MLPDILYLLFSLSLIFSRLIYIVVPISISFLFTVKLYSIIWIYGILLTCSSVGGHLGYLHPVAIVDHAAMNIQVQVLFELLCSTLFSICLELEFLDHMVIPCLTFWEAAKLSSVSLEETRWVSPPIPRSHRGQVCPNYRREIKQLTTKKNWYLL